MLSVCFFLNHRNNLPSVEFWSWYSFSWNKLSWTCIQNSDIMNCNSLVKDFCIKLQLNPLKFVTNRIFPRKRASHWNKNGTLLKEQKYKTCLGTWWYRQIPLESVWERLGALLAAAERTRVPENVDVIGNCYSPT